MQDFRDKEPVGMRCNITTDINNIKTAKKMEPSAIEKETYFARLRWEQKRRKENH